MKAQDILPDDQNFALLGGQPVRKGSVGAFLANVRAIEDNATSDDARRMAWDDLYSLVPALDALGLFEVFELRSPALREAVARHRAVLSPAAAPRA